MLLSCLVSNLNKIKKHFGVEIQDSLQGNLLASFLREETKALVELLPVGSDLQIPNLYVLARVCLTTVVTHTHMTQGEFHTGAQNPVLSLKLVLDVSLFMSYPSKMPRYDLCRERKPWPLVSLQ